MFTQRLHNYQENKLILCSLKQQQQQNTDAVWNPIDKFDFQIPVTCQELGSHYSILRISDKLNRVKKQLFLNP